MVACEIGFKGHQFHVVDVKQFCRCKEAPYTFHRGNDENT